MGRIKGFAVIIIAFMSCGEALQMWNKFKEIGNTVWEKMNKKIPEKYNPLQYFHSNSCIEDLGCFYSGSPFYHPIQRPLSFSPTSRVDLVRFGLYTRSNAEDAYDLRPDPESVNRSTFDPDSDTKLIVHGFLTMDPNHFRERMKDAILSLGKFNVILIDWTAINGPPYSQAVANTRVVGAFTAKLIHTLINKTGASPESFHLIGHSLGAHIAGYAGERVPNLGRITGLDPAGPWFRDTAPEVRLDPTDALFVDVIHTDGSEFVLTGLGTSPPIGHMDFYPNGGWLQPGCAYALIIDHDNGNAIDYPSRFISHPCSHDRSIHYFLESISSTVCKFVSVMCDSSEEFDSGICRQDGHHLVAEMGFHNKMIEGLKFPAKFYLKTNRMSPYCKNDGI